MDQVTLSKAFYNNVKQLFHLYSNEEEKASSALFYKPYEPLRNARAVLKDLASYFETEKLYEIVNFLFLFKFFIIYIF